MARGKGFRIVWKTPPSHLARNIEKYGDRIHQAIFEIGNLIATDAQNRMRNNAPWTDHTGQARAGLRGLAQQAAREMTIIYLITSAPYGKWLELANGARYAVILPTIEQMLPEIKRRLDALFRD